jgi:hypothetical protein
MPLLEHTTTAGVARGRYRTQPRLGLSGKSAKTVFVDREGTLWVATEDTVVFLQQSSKKPVSTSAGFFKCLKRPMGPCGWRN